MAHGIEHLNSAEAHLRADHVTGDLEAREQQSHCQTNRQSDQKLTADPGDDQGRIRRQARQVNDRRQNEPSVATSPVLTGIGIVRVLRIGKTLTMPAIRTSRMEKAWN